MVGFFKSVDNKVGGVNETIHTVGKATLSLGIKPGTGLFHTNVPALIRQPVYERLREENAIYAGRHLSWIEEILPENAASAFQLL